MYCGLCVKCPQRSICLNAYSQLVGEDCGTLRRVTGLGTQVLKPGLTMCSRLASRMWAQCHQPGPCSHRHTLPFKTLPFKLFLSSWFPGGGFVHGGVQPCWIKHVTGGRVGEL